MLTSLGESLESRFSVLLIEAARYAVDTTCGDDSINQNKEEVPVFSSEQDVVSSCR